MPGAVQRPYPVADSTCLFKTRICRMFQRGRCTLGTECTFAHGGDQLRLRPDLFKTRLCLGYLKNRCDDPNCRFAHGQQELRRMKGDGPDGGSAAKGPKAKVGGPILPAEAGKEAGSKRKSKKKAKKAVSVAGSQGGTEASLQLRDAASPRGSDTSTYLPSPPHAECDTAASEGSAGPPAPSAGEREDAFLHDLARQLEVLVDDDLH